MSKIDLIYNYRAIDTVYVIYGPEKVNGNIVVSTEGYIVNSISEVINKINAMVATLSPEITNCQSISSGLYGNMYMQIWRGDLASGSSSSPDYTQILTNINTNLTIFKDYFYRFICILTGDGFSNSSAQQFSYVKKLSEYFYRLCCILTSDASNDSVAQSFSYVKSLDSKFIINNNNITKIIDNCLTSIYNTLRQSVTPNANITDVISALNATIDSKQDTTIVNNDNTNLVQVEGVLDYRLKPQDTM